jgi:hypothetical protein
MKITLISTTTHKDKSTSKGVLALFPALSSYLSTTEGADQLQALYKALSIK